MSLGRTKFVLSEHLVSCYVSLTFHYPVGRGGMVSWHVKELFQNWMILFLGMSKIGTEGLFTLKKKVDKMLTDCMGLVGKIL